MSLNTSFSGLGKRLHQRLGTFRVIGDADQAFNTTSFVASTELTALTYPARVGDVFMVGGGWLWNNNAVTCSVEVFTMVGGSPVTACAPGNIGQGPINWFNNGSAYYNAGYPYAYAVQPQDLSTTAPSSGGPDFVGKTVTFQLMADMGTASSKSLLGSATQASFFYVIPLGPIGLTDVDL